MAPRRAAGMRAAWAGLVRPGAGAGLPAGWLAGEPQASPPAATPARSAAAARIYFSIVIVSEPLIVSGIGSGSCGVVIARVELELELDATRRPSGAMK